MKRTKLRMRGVSETSVLKEQIQSILREIAIIRDGGCVFGKFPTTGACGGYDKNGRLILQFDHMNSRVHAASFSDSRLGVCACKRHHIFYKPQYPMEYERCAVEAMGKERTELLYKVRADRKPRKVDLKLELVALRQELKTLKNQHGN